MFERVTEISEGWLGRGKCTALALGSEKEQKLQEASWCAWSTGKLPQGTGLTCTASCFQFPPLLVGGPFVRSWGGRKLQKCLPQNVRGGVSHAPEQQVRHLSNVGISVLFLGDK